MARTSLLSPSLEPNYPKNCWWVAAKSEEVGREPLSRWLLDLPVVLYRKEDGEAVAMDNRCIHRWAEISSGYLEGDNIVCGYHGARFAPDGRCVHYPTMRKVPGSVRVRSYRVIERGPFVWVWLGDPEAIADAPEPPALEWMNMQNGVVVQGQMPFDANYFMLQENVLDLTHFNYAHRNTFQITDQPVPTFERDGKRVFFRLVQEPYTAAGLHKAHISPDHRISREMIATFVTPALHTVEMTITDLDAGPGERSELKSWITHCTTPESPTKTHYWWVYGQDFGQAPGVEETLKKGIDVAFLEDKEILEGIQRILLRDSRGSDYPEMAFSGDSGGVQARRVLHEMLERERAEPA